MFSIERYVQGFRARSQLLVERLDDEDEVLHPQFPGMDTEAMSSQLGNESRWDRDRLTSFITLSPELTQQYRVFNSKATQFDQRKGDKVNSGSASIGNGIYRQIPSGESTCYN